MDIIKQVLEHVSCIKQDEDNAHPNSSYTDQQFAQLDAAIKEEPPDSYLEFYQEWELIPVKEESNPDLPFLIREVEGESLNDGGVPLNDGGVPKTSSDDNIDNKEEMDDEVHPSVNGDRDLNGDSGRFLQGKNECAEGTPKAVRKRRRRKPCSNIHLSDKRFQCKVCQKCFGKSQHLRCHELFHSNEPQFLCDSCGKGFYTNGDLKRHGRVHTGEKPYACPLCPKTFTQLCNMRSHLTRRCMLKAYGCDLCNKMFENMELLLKHKVCHGTAQHNHKKVWKKRYCQDSPPFFCDMCSLCFYTKRSLITHIKEHNIIGSRLTCEICGRVCPSTERLARHMRSHTGEKPFLCSVCGKAFSQLGNLKKHEILHLPD